LGIREFGFSLEFALGGSYKILFHICVLVPPVKFEIWVPSE
jgi:hypothetical protein